MEIDFKCYKIDLSSGKKSETLNANNESSNHINLSKKRYKIIQVREECGKQFFLIKNLETGNTKEFIYAEVRLYFFSEYLEFMQERSKRKKKKD